MFVVTVTERTPTEPEKKDVNTYHVICESMLDALRFLEEAELNWTCWVNVSITMTKE